MNREENNFDIIDCKNGWLLMFKVLEIFLLIFIIISKILF